MTTQPNDSRKNTTKQQNDIKPDGIEDNDEEQREHDKLNDTKQDDTKIMILGILNQQKDTQQNDMNSE
jgi:hypothetical protein